MAKFSPLAVSIKHFFSRLRAPQSAIRSGGVRPQVVLILGSVAVLVVSQLIRLDVPSEFRLIPLLLIPLNLALFFLGIWAVDKNRLPAWVETFVQALAARLGITSGQFFSLLFSLFFSILTSVAAGFLFRMWSPRAAVVCWGLGILLAVYGCWDLMITRQKISRAAILGGLALFAVALLLRAINTPAIPIVLSGDEASSGLTAVNMLRGDIDNLFITAWFSFPSFHNFLQSISIFIFGQTTQALRLLAALGGSLTVLGVFFVGRAMYGWLPGLMAGIFLAGFHIHNHFSRIGLNNIWDGLFFTLVMGALWVGWQRERRAGFLLAGLGLGLAQYFYTTGRTLILVVVFWLILAGLFDRARFRRSFPNLLLMTWLALIVVLPLALFYFKFPNEFFAPMNRVTIFGSWLEVTAANAGQPQWVVLLLQIWRGLLGYVETPLRAWYTPGVPLLRTLPGIVFLLGLVLMLLRLKDSRSQLLVIWLVWMGITVGLSESTPAAQRYVAAAPAIALLIAFSLMRLGELLVKLWPRRMRWIQAGLLAVVILLAADDARFYYLDYTPRSDFSGFNGLVAQRLADRLKDEPAGTELVFCGYPYMGYDSIASLPYLAPQIHYYNVFEPWGSPDTPQPAGDRVLFAFLPDHDEDKAAVQAQYPGGAWQEWFTPIGEPLMWVYDYKR